MAKPIFQIGTHRFLTLDGQPIPPLNQVDVVNRPGVHGVGLWKLGARGVPFLLISKVDASTKTSARALHSKYKQLISSDPVQLIWSSINMHVSESFLVAVLDVEPADVIRLGSASGGLNPPSLGFIECAWTLIAIAD